MLLQLNWHLLCSGLRRCFLLSARAGTSPIWISSPLIWISWSSVMPALDKALLSALVDR